MTFVSSCTEDTINIGMRLGSSIKSGGVIAFYGDLGAGKTHFVSGLGKGLGFTGETYSPTFSLINEYVGGRVPLYHFDMYRVTGWEDLYSTGFFDYLDMGGLLAVEWSENIEAALPQDTIRITITVIDENSRKIEIEGVDEI